MFIPPRMVSAVSAVPPMSGGSTDPGRIVQLHEGNVVVGGITLPSAVGYGAAVDATDASDTGTSRA